MNTSKKKIFLPLTLLILVLLIGGLSAVSADPGILYVNNATGNDSWNGQSVTFNSSTGDGPKLSIKNATGSVDNNGLINIADGLYTGENNTNISISKNLTIIGQSQSGTIINAENMARIFSIQSDVTVTIKNLTLTGGDANFAGAILNTGNLSIVNCTFTNSAADSAGAIGNQGVMDITGSTFQENTADAREYGGFGGAIFNDNLGILTISHSTFQQNTALAYGGAIVNGGTLNILDTIFSNNNAAYFVGGAIYNYGNLSVSESNFTSNYAPLGGAIFHQGDDSNPVSITVHSSTFSQNNAGEGGAFYIYGGDYNHNIIEFCRIVENIATSGNAIAIPYGSVNATRNWWGNNDPEFSSLISGTSDYNPWIVMTLTANPSTINNTQSSLITASFNYLWNGSTLTPLDPLLGHIPDGTPVNFQTDLGTIGSKNVDKTTLGGFATVTLIANELAGTATLNATTDQLTMYQHVLINPTSSLYLNITPGKTNPVAGDTVTYTLKVGNYGPDPAENVVMTYMVPDGLEFVGASDDVGNIWTYDPSTRTITWTLGTVPKGDPSLNLTLRVLMAGNFLINPILSTTTYDPTLNTNTHSLSIYAAPNTTNQVNAATVTAANENTVGMQTTGAPIAPLALGIIVVLGGLVTTRRKN